MSELPPADDVARGVDPPVRRAQPIVDADPSPTVELDAGRLEAEPLDVRGAPDRDQDRVDLHGPPTRGLVEGEAGARGRCLDANQHRTERELDAIGRECA